MSRARDLADLGGSASNGFNPSNVLEVVSLNCDGGSVTVPSGTYTSANVTAAYSLTSSWADITGSSITYTPPSDATSVIYEFNYQVRGVDAHGIAHLRFMIDTTEVVYARSNISANSAMAGRYHFRWVIPIGGTTSTDTGRQNAWSSGKVLKLMAREYGSSNESNMHQSQHWNGSASSTFMAPTLMITAVKDTS